ncbi:MAG TPA: hypothetical protein VJL82_07090 [Rhizomicrobium sp.]|nr:hypothetical protein [Rhizomicrobium sp.]
MTARVPGVPLLALRAVIAACPILMGVASCWILIVLRRSELDCAYFASLYIDTLNFYNFANLAAPWVVVGVVQLIRFYRPLGLLDGFGVLGAVAAVYSLNFIGPYLSPTLDAINCNAEGYAIWRERFFFDSGAVIGILGQILTCIGALLIGASLFIAVIKSKLGKSSQAVGEK